MDRIAAATATATARRGRAVVLALKVPKDLIGFDIGRRRSRITQYLDSATYHGFLKSARARIIYTLEIAIDYASGAGAQKSRLPCAIKDLDVTVHLLVAFRHELYKVAVYGERKRSLVGQHFWARGSLPQPSLEAKRQSASYIRHQEREDQRLNQMHLLR